MPIACHWSMGDDFGIGATQGDKRCCVRRTKLKQRWCSLDRIQNLRRWLWAVRALWVTASSSSKDVLLEDMALVGVASRLPRERFANPLRSAFAFVATHNHFVLDRGGKVFNHSAPVIKLPPGPREDDHLAAARAAQQLHGLLLDEAGVPQQGQHGRRSRAPARPPLPSRTSTNSQGPVSGVSLPARKSARPRPRVGPAGPRAPGAPAGAGRGLPCRSDLGRGQPRRRSGPHSRATPSPIPTRAELDAHRTEAERLLRR